MAARARLGVWLVALCGVAFSSCSGSDEDPPGQSKDGGVSGTGGVVSTDGGWSTGGAPSGGSGGSAAGSGGSAATGGGGLGGTGGTGGGPSCGDVAAQQGWASAACEWNGNNACQGSGTPTYDCDYCCQVGGSTGGSSGTGGASPGNGFGYPVGDKTTNPAGGWVIWQVLGHYWSAYGGRHLAQDVAHPSGGVASVNAPVYSIADGTVVYARTNTSSYKNVIAIKHEVGDGTRVCSFFGHIWDLQVSAGQTVVRGQQIAKIISWAQAVSGGAASNTHLHYAILSEALCDKSVTHNVCGYDKGGANGVPRTDWNQEPYFYTAVNDNCGASEFPNGLISPSKFIADHHF